MNNTTDFHTDSDEVHQAELANLATMARSIFHQVGATEVAQPELTTLVNFNGENGANPRAGFIADTHGNLFSTTDFGTGGTVFELSAHSYSLTTLLGGPLMDSGVIIDAHGDLFGTTSTGGSTNDGNGLRNPQ
jgi:hypothetical protein